MGNKNTKSAFRNAIIHLNISADPVGVHNDKFWSQILGEDPAVAWEVIKSISIQEIRMLRDGSPKNFATLIYKMVERLCLATGTLCNTSSQQTAVLNSTRILIRVIPSVFEDDDWRHFFERNYLSTAGDLREEPTLVFVEKDSSKKDYTSYLPVKLPSSTELPLQKHKSGEQEAGDTKATDKTMDKDLLDDSSGDNLLASDLDECKVDPLQAKRLNKRQEAEESSISLIDDFVVDHCHAQRDDDQQPKQQSDSSLMSTLVQSICDLLFCPEFTVLSHDYTYLSNAVDAPPEDLKSLSTCDYVWEPGVGFDSSVNSTTNFDRNRSELVRLLLACLSVTLYQTTEQSIELRNNWLEWFVSRQNRHTLPLFTSFLNVSLSYKPSINLPTLLPTTINRSMFDNDREELVELSIQILIATLDYSKRMGEDSTTSKSDDRIAANKQPTGIKGLKQDGERGAIDKEHNLFIDYLTRIHREEDFDFLVKGFSRLLGNRLELSGYLISKKQIEFEQELLILFWKICSLNQKFVQHLLKSNEILRIILPLLYHMNENFQDPSRTALIHICVFNLLILSSERNFGVKLNKPYTSKLLDNLPDFTGTHADLLIIVFHKLIMYGYDINQLYDYLMTIVANISPYLKNLNLLSAKCLIQLFETFSSVYVIFTEPSYHSMVVFLLEIFNNIIQYQFDGNTNLVYMILIKKDLFTNLFNLSTSQNAIDKILRKLIKRKQKMRQLMDAEGTGEQEATNTTASDKNQNQDNTSEAKTLTQESSSIATGTSSTQTDEANQKGNDGNSSNTSRRQNLATVSSSSPQSHHSVSSGDQQFFKQEVSLVETPDLNHVTQPIHPYDSMCRFLDNINKSTIEEPAKEEAGRCEEQKKAEVEKKSAALNLVDDLLNEKFEGLTWPSNSIDGPLSSSNADSKLLDGCTKDLANLGQELAIPVADCADLNNETDNPKERSNPSSTCSSNVVHEETKSRKWKPTSKWLKEWKQTLPLQTVLRTIEVLVPQIEQLPGRAGAGSTATPTPAAAAATTTTQDESEVIKFLQSGTLVGLLPVPHPILIRKYRTNNSRSILWFRSYTWGIIYVRNSIWTNTHIKLIKTI